MEQTRLIYRLHFKDYTCGLHLRIVVAERQRGEEAWIWGDGIGLWMILG
ncbi:MAG: hypothetical protein OD811_00235 [Alphaproteobacteria bacterium]